MNSWAFNQLNQLSPDSSPTNGPGSDERSESSLSFPVSGAELQAQLEAWTNVAFDFDSNDFGAAFDNKDDLVSGHEYYGRLGSTSAHNNNDPLQSLLSLETPTQSGDSPASSLASTASPAADPFAGLYSSASPSTSFHSVVDTSLLPSSFGVPNFPAFAAPSVTAAGATLPQSSIVVPPPTTVAPVTVSAVTAAPAPAPKKAAPKKRRQSTVQAQAPPPPVAETPVPEEAILDDDAANALAVEEDKRRRNTAASARFRVKKKQREAALEATAKELKDKVSNLEREVESLRTENGWLRGLLVGKEEGKTVKKEAFEEELPAAKRARVDFV